MAFVSHRLHNLIAVLLEVVEDSGFDVVRAQRIRGTRGVPSLVVGGKVVDVVGALHRICDCGKVFEEQVHIIDLVGAGHFGTKLA